VRPGVSGGNATNDADHAAMNWPRHHTGRLALNVAPVVTNPETREVSADGIALAGSLAATVGAPHPAPLTRRGMARPAIRCRSEDT